MRSQEIHINLWQHLKQSQLGLFFVLTTAIRMLLNSFTRRCKKTAVPENRVGGFSAGMAVNPSFLNDALIFICNENHRQISVISLKRFYFHKPQT